MRKTLVWLMVFLLLLSALASCGKKENKEPSETTGRTESNSSNSEDGSVKVTKNKDGSLFVEIALTKNANQDVSVLVTKNRETATSLNIDSDAVLAIEQITLDADGKGSVTLQPSENASCYVSINGKHIVEVKG